MFLRVHQVHHSLTPVLRADCLFWAIGFMYHYQSIHKRLQCALTVVHVPDTFWLLKRSMWIHVYCVCVQYAILWTLEPYSEDLFTEFVHSVLCGWICVSVCSYRNCCWHTHWPPSSMWLVNLTLPLWHSPSEGTWQSSKFKSTPLLMPGRWLMF